MNLNEFDYTFTDTELQEILGLIEQKAASQDVVSTQDFPCTNGALPPPYGLQFQPHAPAGTVLAPSVTAGAVGPVASPFVENPVVATGYPVKADPEHQQQIHYRTSMTGHGLEHSASFPMTDNMVMIQPPSAVMPDAANCISAGVNHNSYYVTGAGLGVLCPSPYPGGLSAPSPSASYSKVSKSAASQLMDNKSSVNHSFVEKQRRDRINSLIDELRDLVPPQKNAPKTDASDARRPKHVVLSDTVALLKSLQDKLKLDSSIYDADDKQFTLIKPEPASPERGKSDIARERRESLSDSQGDMESGGITAPDMPNFPLTSSGVLGVSVEKGPDCLYVQVKCKDRRGLLSDIINALKLLPLEIRTAAVTTTQSGIVHDVFEVRADDESLDASSIEGVLLKSLAAPNAESLSGKRLRQSFEAPP